MSDWIRVDVALPEKRGRYLVFHYYTPSAHIVFWNGYEWDPDFRYYGKLNITNWMPLTEYDNDCCSVGLATGNLIAIDEL